MNSHRQSAPAVAPFYFGLVTAKFYETWDFYTEQLGFRTLQETDDTVLLIHASGGRLGIMRHETDESYPERMGATDGRGIWIQLEVPDVEAAFERMRAADVPVVKLPGPECSTARCFTVRDPNGVLILVAGEVAPSVSAAERLWILAAAAS